MGAKDGRLTVAEKRKRNRIIFFVVGGALIIIVTVPTVTAAINAADDLSESDVAMSDQCSAQAHAFATNQEQNQGGIADFFSTDTKKYEQWYDSEYNRCANTFGFG
jgi:hypothetical protein